MELKYYINAINKNKNKNRLIDRLLLEAVFDNEIKAPDYDKLIELKNQLSNELQIIEKLKKSIKNKKFNNITEMEIFYKNIVEYLFDNGVKTEYIAYQNDFEGCDLTLKLKIQTSNDSQINWSINYKIFSDDLFGVSRFNTNL